MVDKTASTLVQTKAVAPNRSGSRDDVHCRALFSETKSPVSLKNALK